MKGDFTRFTFQPNKQYTSVLMQQGRLQLDADWNEQMSILAYLDRVQIRDTIGAAAGTSETAGGFAIHPTSDNQDLTISPGRFYINGLLCELVRGTDLKVTQPDSTALKLTVSNWLVDGQEFQVGQWVEILVNSTPATTTPQIKKITDIDPKLQILTLDTPLDLTLANSLTELTLRRLTTYNNQPDYPNPKSDDDGEYLVYLDAWQRHITTIEDPSICEVALQVPDTATRTKTVWQVKLLRLEEENPLTIADTDKLDDIIAKIKARTEWQQLTGNYSDNNQILAGRRVELTASTDRNPGANLPEPGAYQGNDNRLYRIEVHQSGSIETATFKWSRDNGSVVSAIDSIENDVINLISSSKEVYKRFENEPGKQQPWLEIISEEQELKNEPGTLVQLVKAKPNQLTFNLSKIRGTIPTATKASARSQNLKVRLWHDTPDGEIIVTKDWIALEDGISIKFNAGTFTTTANENGNYEFKNGDFWLIPARESTRSIEWARDGQNRWQPQPSQGIYHQYTPLAIAKKTANAFQPGIENSWELSDLRIKFPTLVNCFDKKRGDFIEGSLGVGFRGTPPATLYVRGNKNTQPNGTQIDLPIVQFDRNDGTNQFIIDPQGNIGIGTIASSIFKLDVKGNTQIDGALNIKDLATFSNNITLDRSAENTISSVNNLSLIATNGDLNLKGRKINIDGTLELDEIQFNSLGININPPTDPNFKLQVNGGVKIGDVNKSIDLKPPTANTEPVTFTTTSTKGYQFDKSIILKSGDISFTTPTAIVGTISASAAKLSFKTDDSDSIVILKDGKVGIGTSTPSTQLEVKGLVTISDGTANHSIKLAPPTDTEPVKFTTTSTKGYQFDKGISIESGDISLGTIGSIDFSNSKLSFKTNELDRLTIANDKIGIGVIDPQARLHLQAESDTSEIIRLDDKNNDKQLAVTVQNTGTTFNGNINVEGNLEMKGILVTTSSKLFKDNITNLSSQEVRQILQGLNPVKFTYKADQSQTLQLGFIAEEVPDVIASSDRKAISPLNIIAALTKVVKDHQSTITTLIDILKEQKQEIATLSNKIQSLEDNHK
jgi:Family of unknown function (DUF6519)/Chaperone of endosialidase